MRYIFTIVLALISIINTLANDIDTIDIAFTKTVLLIFDEDTKVLPGSEQIQATTDANTVTIIALEEYFEETNLIVKEGNRYHSFILRYNDSPKQYIFPYTSGTQKSGSIVIDSSQILKENAEIQKETLLNENYHLLSKLVFNKQQTISDIGDITGKVYFMLLNMYVKDDLIFFKVGINNKSKIDYKIQRVSFDIRNIDKRLKPSSNQKVQKSILYTFNELSNVKAKTSETMVFVLDKFTLDNERKLHIEMWEEGGDRICQFELSANQLLEIEQL